MLCACIDKKFNLMLMHTGVLRNFKVANSLSILTLKHVFNIDI